MKFAVSKDSLKDLTSKPSNASNASLNLVQGSKNDTAEVDIPL